MYLSDVSFVFIAVSLHRCVIARVPLPLTSAMGVVSVFLSKSK